MLSEAGDDDLAITIPVSLTDAEVCLLVGSVRPDLEEVIARQLLLLELDALENPNVRPSIVGGLFARGLVTQVDGATQIVAELDATLEFIRHSDQFAVITILKQDSREMIGVFAAGSRSILLTRLQVGLVGLLPFDGNLVDLVTQVLEEDDQSTGTVFRLESESGKTQSFDLASSDILTDLA